MHWVQTTEDVKCQTKKFGPTMENKIIHIYFRKSILAEQGEIRGERGTQKAAAEFQGRAKARTKTHHFLDVLLQGGRG